MSELPLLLLAVVVGALAGGIFFGGLWYTVSHLPVVSKPKLFFLQSYWLRTALVLLLLYFSNREFIKSSLVVLICSALSISPKKLINSSIEFIVYIVLFLYVIKNYSLFCGKWNSYDLSNTWLTLLISRNVVPVGLPKPKLPLR